MAKKKVQKDTDNKLGDYEVQIGFINKFDYSDTVYKYNMGGHPRVGGVYRMIKDSQGYRLHIGRDQNKLGLDGLFLGPNLNGSQQDFDFSILVVDNTNFLHLDLSTGDANQVAEWLESGSPDLWDRIKVEVEGATPIVKKMDDLKNSISDNELKEIIEKSYSEVNQEQVDFEAAITEYLKDDIGEVDKQSMQMSIALSTISTKDPDMLDTMIGLMEYIASTYSDKYESAEIPNLSKHILTNTGIMGKGANVFNIFKYTQRYATTGFKKSENPQDLYKAIHYAMFELQRKRNMVIDENESNPE